MFVLLDGVSEAMNAVDDFFGEERLLAELAAEPGAGPARVVERVLGAVRTFAAGAPQSDDITILAAQCGKPV
jgi:sigma-B regulation protein RsbU (phosphoserine phosphatase)